MSLRLALYDLAMHHTLGRDATQRLLQLANPTPDPQLLRTRLWKATAVIGAALGGLGLVMWIAANWETMDRSMRFALLQGFLVVLYGAALARPAARAPLGLLALLGTGALFAFFGQTYQTGADPWQLFAVWAVLTLPLALAVRSDAVWTPWMLVVFTGITLWIHAHVGHRWNMRPEDLKVHLVAMATAAGLFGATAPQWQHRTGIGLWGRRSAGALTVFLTTSIALGGLYNDGAFLQYLLGLGLLAGCAAWLSQPRSLEMFLLSSCALGLDVLLVCGMFYLLAKGHSGDFLGTFLTIGLLAAGVVAGSVQLVLRAGKRAQAWAEESATKGKSPQGDAA